MNRRGFFAALAGVPVAAASAVAQRGQTVTVQVQDDVFFSRDFPLAGVHSADMIKAMVRSQVDSVMKEPVSVLANSRRSI